MKILPYKTGSVSAKALATALGCKVLRNDEGQPVFTRAEAIINWGCSAPKRRLQGQRIINPFASVAVSVDKLATFQRLREADVSIPEFFTVHAEAEAAIRNDRKIVCRTNLRGYGGDGIVIAERVDQLVDAPLYVRYIPKENEYRVHVVNGIVVFVQRKARKHDVPDDQVNWQIRNLAGGFIYANQNVELDDLAKGQAIQAVAALGLDFGAVDLLVTSRGRPYVLEVNTACGLAGTTVERYREALARMQL